MVPDNRRSDAAGNRFPLNFRVLLFFFCLLLLGGTSVFAQEIPRTILAFYDPKAALNLPPEGLKKIAHPTTDYVYSNIHLHAEMPLNHLGLEVVYRNIEAPLPTDPEMTGFRGVFTWFNRLNAVPDPQAYCQWLTRQLKQGRKVVIWGEPGIFANKKRRMPQPCREFFRALGAEYLGNYSDTPFFWKLVYKDPKRVEFERKISFAEGLEYSQYRLLPKRGKSYLQIEREDMEESLSDLVFITPLGGFAHSGFLLYFNRDIARQAWRINPFLFFEDAYALKGLPRPDVTTLNGRRIFYNQIDGDGIFNISHIDNESFSGEIAYDEILKKYPGIPVTASIITGYLDLPEFKSERVTKLYRDIFSLPNIEPASHGYAHPFIWAKKTLALKIPRYKFDAAREIQGSVKMLQGLLQREGINKKVELFLWTGDAIPDQEEIGLTYQMGLLNLNGGSGSFDRRHDSYSYLMPIGILRGPFRQIYASDPNEYFYTNDWEGPYYGFVELIDNFEKTESPIRVKPMDLYYHYYIAERQAGLKTVHDIYNYVFARENFPVFAGEYARIANGFFAAKVAPLPAGGFRITNNGSMKTIRFDGEKRNVNLERSRGVLGFRHYQGSLYVALGDSAAHDIYLTKAPAAKPYVESASFHVSDFRGDRRRLSFLKKGWLKSEIVLGGMIPKGSYQVAAGEETLLLRADRMGLLNIGFKSAENTAPPRRVTVEARY